MTNDIDAVYSLDTPYEFQIETKINFDLFMTQLSVNFLPYIT